MLKRVKALIVCAALITSAVCSTGAVSAVELTPKQSTKNAVVDENAVSAVAQNSDNPQTAGEMLNDISNTNTYEEALRSVLDEYYISSDEESVQALCDIVDSRADTIIENYEQASAERSTDEIELGYMSGEVLAVTKADITDEEIPEIVTDSRMSIVSVNSYKDSRKLVKISIPLEDTVESAISKLESNEYIDYIQKDFIYSTEDIFAEELSNDYYTDQLFHLNAVNAPDAWNYIESTPHQKVKVGIIDTGAQLDHPDLENVINKDLSVRISSDGIVAPLNGDNGCHGSHVSGIVAGEANNSLGVAGVASSVNNDAVELVEIGSDTGTGNSLSSLVIYKAILYAIDNNIRVINMSLGGATDPDNIFQSAIDLANKSGCVVVCAAGNESSSDYHYPSDCDGTISVIALDESCDKRADYSNYGGKSNKVSAPGTSILSCVPETSPVYNYSKGYESYSGTSMATPVVTAIAGMMLSVNPQLTASQIKDIIFSTCTDMGASGYDIEFGNGIVNAYAAVKKAAETDTADVPTAIKLSNSKISLTKGNSFKLSSTVTCNGDYKDVYYHSEDESIVKVDQYGKVTAIATGETQIIVSTENGITASCVAAVTSKDTSQLSTPTAKAVQTGIYTGARIKWNGVSNADYYQIYATCSNSNTFRYLGSTSSTSYSANMGLGGDEIPASNVTRYKIRAISKSSVIKDSELSNEFAYVYVGQEPFLTADQILNKNYDTGLMLHWSAIACSKLYRHSNIDSTDILLSTFGEDHTLNYYNDTDLTNGVTYTYTLKMFTEYNGVEYSEVTDTLTIDYLDDDPLDTSLGKTTMKGVSFINNKLSVTYIAAPTCGVNQCIASANNGKSWFDMSNMINNTYNPNDADCGNWEYGKTYLIKCKSFYNQLFGTYRNRSEYSDTYRVTIPDALEPPQITVESSSTGTAHINWNSVEKADYYTVYRKQAGTGKWQQLKSYIKDCEYSDNTLKSDTIYYYKITATDVEPDFTAQNITGTDFSISFGPQSSDYSNIEVVNNISTSKYMSLAKINSIANQSFTGSAIEPKITVTYNDKPLVQNSDYTIDYLSNTQAGTAYVKVTGKNGYTGSRTVPFNIVDNTVYNYHTVTFKDYDGTVIATQKVKDGSSAKNIQPPYREGYEFRGWDKQLNKITADATVTATYVNEEKVCNVAFLDKDGNVIETQKVAYGNAAKAPSVPEYKDYSFTGWSNQIQNITESLSVKAMYTATQFESGNGTSSSPYVISDKEQLNLFSKLVNSSDEYASACYILKNDIVYNDMADSEHWGNDNTTNEQNKPDNVWTPAGSDTRPFKGSFNGNGHTILGLYIFEMNSNAGFIGYAENADIYSLGIRQMYLKTEQYYAGGIAGKYVNSAMASHKLYNCYVKESCIIASSICGGIVGEFESTTRGSTTTLADCYSNDCYLYSLWENVIGGLAGKVTSSGGNMTIKYCYAYNAINVRSSNSNFDNIGELIGTFTPNTSNNALCTIDTCYYCAVNQNNCYPIGNYEYYLQNRNGSFYFVNLNFLTQTDIEDAGNYSFNSYTNGTSLNLFPDRVWNLTQGEFPSLYYENDWYSLTYYLDDAVYCMQYYHKGEQITLPDRYFGGNYIATDWSFEDSATHSTMPANNLKAYATTYIVGDANGDDKVSIVDATLIQKHLAETSSIESTQLTAADVNADGRVNIVDASLIQKYCAGTITSFAANNMPQKQTLPTEVTQPTTQPVTTAPVTTVPATTQPTTQAVKTITIEDNTPQKWLSNDSAVIVIVDNATNASYEAPQTNGKWTATVPATVKDITVNRMNPAKDKVWNSWNTTILGTTFKITGDTSGNWY